MTWKLVLGAGMLVNWSSKMNLNSRWSGRPSLRCTVRQRIAATESEREHRVREPGLVLTPMCALSLLVEDPSV